MIKTDDKLDRTLNTCTVRPGAKNPFARSDGSSIAAGIKMDIPMPQGCALPKNQVSSQRIGSWIQVFSGHKFWPMDPRPEEIFIEDIAHALSLQCRFAGHTRVHYSVGEHSYRLARFCSRENMLWGLLHDAAEAYLVDLPKPIKDNSILGEQYTAIENGLMRVICERFSLPLEFPDEVKALDKLMVQWEQRDLMAKPPEPWKDRIAKLPEYELVPISPELVEARFLRLYDDLRPQATL